MIAQQACETRPLESWSKMKEMKREFFLHKWQCKERGGTIIFGGGLLNFCSLLSGLGDAVSFGEGIYFSTLMRNPDLAKQCFEAIESKGYGIDICSSSRVLMGSMFLGMHNKSPQGVVVQPDFWLDINNCESRSKCVQVFAEYYKIPFFTIEVPFAPTPEGREMAVSLLANQIYDYIDWAQKTTGKTWDDEKFVEGVKNEWRSQTLGAKICMANQAVPAPLALKHIDNFLTFMHLIGRQNSETPDFLQTLLAEIEGRVRDGIAGVPYETARLWHEGQVPWFFRPLVKYPEAYGASFIGSRFEFQAMGVYAPHEDGSWEAAMTPEERGIHLRSRDDAVRALAELYVIYSHNSSDRMIAPRVTEMVAAAKAWHLDGVVFHMDLGCKGIVPGHLEAKLALQKIGVPTFIYEGSNCDPRNLATFQVLDRMDSFLESLGLHKIEATAK